MFFIISLLCAAMSFASDVTLVSYNVENLFDNIHDEGHTDWTYSEKGSPLKKNCKDMRTDRFEQECRNTDWTTTAIAKKIDAISSVILSKTKPTILGIVEIENENVVSLLAKRLGYSHWVITHGDDSRGINVAVLFNEDQNFKMIRSEEHKIEGEYFLTKPTRHILEVGFQLGTGQQLTVFVNHWPSQSNPSLARVLAAKKLNSIIEQRSKSEPNFNAIAMGDFNTVDRDYPAPFGSLTNMVDLTPTLKYKSSSKKITGTYYFRPDRAWNMLDRFFITKSLQDGKVPEVDISSLEIISPEFAVRGIHGSGDPMLSDHLPIFLRVSL